MLWKWATLSIRATTGEPGRDLFTGLFDRQMEGSGNGASLITLIWAPFFGPRLCYESESGGKLELQ